MTKGDGGRSTGRAGWAMRWTLPLVLILAASLPAVHGAAMATAQEEPATPVAQTIAQGVDLMPEVPVAWRLLASAAEVREEAPFASRTLGFVLGDEGEVLVTDEDTEAQSVVAPGEAAFHREGASEQRASLDEDEPASYFAIELIVADAAEDEETVGESELRFVSNEFEAPEGNRELSLQRTVLDAGEAIEVEGSDTRAFLFLTDGAIEGTDESDEARAFEAGDAVAFTGRIELEAGEEGATYVVASIGREVEPLPTPTPEPTEEPDPTGTLFVTLFDCPEGVDPQEDASDCEETEDAAGVEVADVDDPDETLEGERDGATFTFADLPEATYALLGLREEDDERIVYAAPPAEAGQQDYLVTVEAGEEVEVDVFRYPAPTEANGTLAITIFDCPEGEDPSAGETDRCEAGEDDFGASVQITDESVPDDSDEFLLENAERDGDAYVLSDLLAGTYALLGFGPINADVAVFAAPPAEASQDGYVVELPPGETVAVEVYRYTPEVVSDTGTLAITVFDCPEGVDATVDASECTAGDDEFLFYVYDPEELEIIAFTDDGERDGDAYLLELDPGTYGIASDNLPANALVAIGGDGFQTQDGPQVTVVAGETSTAEVYVYLLEE